MTTSEIGWGSVPMGCTLPQAQLPRRLAEFADVFAVVRRVERPEPTRLLLVLQPAAGCVVAVRDLAARVRLLFVLHLRRAGGERWRAAAGHRAEGAGRGARRNGRPGRKNQRCHGATGVLVTGGDGLRSGQVAAAAGVNIQTLRYHERRGLLEKPARTLGGHRLAGKRRVARARGYPPESVGVLRIIKAAQRLGFTLEEVAELLEAGRHRHGRGAGVLEAGALQARAERKLAEVEAKMADLAVIRESLRAALAAGCEDLTVCAATVGCPLPFVDLAHQMETS